MEDLQNEDEKLKPEQNQETTGEKHSEQVRQEQRVSEPLAKNDISQNQIQTLVKREVSKVLQGKTSSGSKDSQSVSSSLSSSNSAKASKKQSSKKKKTSTKDSKKPLKEEPRRIYTELRPLLVPKENLITLLSFRSSKVQSILKNYQSDCCLISPCLLSYSPEKNMCRCLKLITKLKNFNYKYFPVYMSDETNKITDITFVVYPFQQENDRIVNKRQPRQLFEFISSLAKENSIPSYVFYQKNKFVLMANNEFFSIKTNSFEQTLLYYAKVRQMKVLASSMFYVNNESKDEREFHMRNNVYNEIVIQWKTFAL